MLKWTFAIAFAVLTAAGCKTTEEKIAEDDTKCRSYSVAVGSPAYVECRMRLDQARSDRAALARHGQEGGLFGAIKAMND